MNFLHTYAPYVTRIELELKNYLSEIHHPNNNPILNEFYQLITDQILSGGKRLRPLCMTMAYKGYNSDDDIIVPSISPELVHASSLILDDAMDEDVMRHGEPTFNAVYADKFLSAMDFDISKYGKGRYWIQRDTLKNLFFAQKAISRYSYALAVLGSNVIYSLSLDALMKARFEPSKMMHATELHRSMYQKLNEGQLMDILYESRHANEKEYLAMIHKKTGILFVYPIRLGLNFSSCENTGCLDEYATSIAKAFQIQDDILGSFGSEKITGKSSFSDIREGKRTLLVIKAFENADEQQQKVLTKVLGYEHASREDVEEVRNIFKDTGAYGHCIELSKKFIENSKTSIPDDMSQESRKFFEGLADFVIERNR